MHFMLRMADFDCEFRLFKTHYLAACGYIINVNPLTANNVGVLNISVINLSTPLSLIS